MRISSSFRIKKASMAEMSSAAVAWMVAASARPRATDAASGKNRGAPAERRDEHQKRASPTTNRTTRHDAHAINLDTRARARAAKHAAHAFAQKPHDGMVVAAGRSLTLRAPPRLSG